MKTRPKPKKISFIKLNTNSNNNKNDNKLNNKKDNKNKKHNAVLSNNFLFLNSPKNGFMPSTSKYNEKLLNKIKEYSLESQLLNQVMHKSTKNRNKIHTIKYTNEKENDNNKNNLNEIKFNSLDNNTINTKKIKNINIDNNKFRTERQINPFAKEQNDNLKKNIIINVMSSNENDTNKNMNIKNQINKIFESKTNNAINKRKRREIYDNNLKLSKKNIFKKTDNNNKRNTSANNRIVLHRKHKNNIFKQNSDEFNININNTEENENFDVHKSYNLITKNSFNFYYPDTQFPPNKNMQSKAWKNKKDNFEIKEENEYKNIIYSEQKKKHKNKNKLELSFTKSKTNIKNNSKDTKKSNKNCNKIKPDNNNKIHNKNNKKEKVLASLRKERIILSNLGKDISPLNSEFKDLSPPDTYSFDKIRNNDTIIEEEEKNKYLILNKNKAFKNKKFNITNFLDKENTKIIEKIKILNQHKWLKDEGSFYTRRKLYNENKKKSLIINKFENHIDINYQKISFLNSPNIKTSHINKNRNEYSYDGVFKRNTRIIKFHKLHNTKEKSESKSHSNSKSKSKSRSKSQLNKLKTSNNYDNKLTKLIFLIKSNWGNTNKLGINNIQLKDKNNKNIPIIKANFDLTKSYQTKYIKGEIKKLIIEYEANNTLKNISILNGFSDIGIKYLTIENDRGKILWKGVVPKANLINSKSFYISVDNNNILNKKRLLFSKTVYLKKAENNNNINNLKYVNNTFRNTKQNESSDNINKNYVLCDRVKIKLINNYGNKDYIGLSGIQFFDNNNELINIIKEKKDIKINEAIMNLKEKKILYNLFNNKNDTTNPKHMFLTTNFNAFINIEFKQSIKISKIIFYNYNNNIYKDCATKEIFLDFYINNTKQKIINKSIYLYRPPGEEKINYGQILLYPFNENADLINKIKENLKILKVYNKINKIIYNEEYQYYCPLVPFGHIIKIEMINNYGNKDYIGIENIQIFNEENKEMLLFPSLAKNDNEIKDNEESINILYPRIFIMPEGTEIKSKKKPLIFSKLYNFNDVDNYCGENDVYFIFNHFFGISKICIYNYENYLDIAAKHIKILFDDNIIFEGDLKNIEINNIYFCDKKYLVNKNDNRKMPNKKNNLSHEFENKIKEFRKNINNSYNIDRYIEYEGKNGTKILKLSDY